MGQTGTKPAGAGRDDEKDPEFEIEEKLEYYRKIPVANPGDVNYLLDIGTGEIGLYSFVIQEDGYPLMSGKKAKLTFLKDLLRKKAKDENQDFIPGLRKDFGYEPGDKDGHIMFADLIFNHYELGNKDIKILKLLAGGATGENRRRFERSPQDRRHIIRFFKNTELYFDTEFGLQADFQVFVPKGDQEAQWELASTEFLLKVASVGKALCTVDEFGKKELHEVYEKHRKGGKMGNSEFNQALDELKLPQDIINRVWDGASDITFEEFGKMVKSDEAVFQAFAKTFLMKGTIAAGGGSTQMTLKAEGNDIKSVSLPIGNKLPFEFKTQDGRIMWPDDQISPDQEKAWVDRVALLIGEGASRGLQTGLEGFYVGISAFYYCASLCEFAEQVVQKREVITKIENTLGKLRANSMDPKHKGKYDPVKKPKDFKRAMANCLMIRAFIDHVFSDNAYFLFQRNWKVRDNKEKFVATWSFGWFVTEIGMA